MDEAFVRRAFWGCLAGGAGGLVAGIAAYLRPRLPLPAIDAGPITAYDVGTVRSFAVDLVAATIGGTRAVAPLGLAASVPSLTGFRYVSLPKLVHVVRREDGFCALSGRCPHMGQEVRYRPDLTFSGKRGLFRCVSHGGMFNLLDGRVVFGPPPRSLDALRVRIVAGRVHVDVRPESVIRRPGDKPPPVAPVPADVG